VLDKELGDAELARDPRMHDFVVPDDCTWDTVARTTERDLGRELNHAMRAIERFYKEALEYRPNGAGKTSTGST